MIEPDDDLAHEADMRALIRQQLRDNITPREAAEELAELEELQAYIGSSDGDHFFCTCNAQHSVEEIDWNQCDCCGKDIV